MANSGPPESVPVGRLFRLVSRRPRPMMPIDHRIRGAESIALSIQALRPVEEAEALGAPLGRDKSGISERHARLVAASLLADGSLAFSSHDVLMRHMASREFIRLANAVLDALATVSPSYLTSDTIAWRDGLRKGAKENVAVVSAMSSCVDISLGFGAHHAHGRPDRYYGLPVAELTDGQRMAFSAALHVTEVAAST